MFVWASRIIRQSDRKYSRSKCKIGVYSDQLYAIPSWDFTNKCNDLRLPAGLRRKQVRGPQDLQNSSTDRLIIFHYLIKHREYWDGKIHRDKKFGAFSWNELDFGCFPFVSSEALLFNRIAGIPSKSEDFYYIIKIQILRNKKTVIII